MKKIIKVSISKAISVSVILSMLSMFVAPSFATAASLTAAKDTLTRTKISTTADHTIVFTLPTGVDFDSTTQTDILRVDFPHSSAFTQSGTWVTGDFTFNDGTSRTINAVAQGAGTIDCTVSAGVNNVCVAIDTTNHIFSIKPSSTYTASSTAATITFTIDGTTTDGTLTNPSSANNYAVDFAMCDETASCTSSFTSSHTTQVGLGINDDDQVSVTATVNASLTFDIDTASGGGNGESSTPYSVGFGAITTTDTRVSGTTDTVQMIVLEADTNATSGVIVTVKDANGSNGLVSTSVSGDNINSADGTMADGTENYGLCVATSGLSGFSRASPYNSGTCATDSETNDIQGLTAGGENIVSTTGPVSAAHAEVIANAAVAGTTVAHTDYADTLTFIATGTF